MDNRTESIRKQIDRCDEAILRALEERVFWVRKMHEGQSGVRMEYRRETEIGARYADAVERMGARPAWGYRLAATVVDLGKSVVRHGQAQDHR